MIFRIFESDLRHDLPPVLSKEAKNVVSASRFGVKLKGSDSFESSWVSYLEEFAL